MRTPSVHAVIPNYNMAPSLGALLPEVLDQEYDSVYVLDDASTDESLEVVNEYHGEVTVIAGAENVGAGANRNRIIDQLGTGALIHFIDADMKLESDRLPERCRESKANEPTTGFVGGLVNDSDGRQMIFNYGPRQSLRNDATVPLHMAVAAIGDHSAAAELSIRKNFRILDGWPHRQETPEEKEVFWTSEANLIIKADLFNSIGGYDSTLREHEIQDLAIRLSKLRMPRYFDSSIAMTHTAAEVRGGNRNTGMVNAERYIARKHGVREWITSK